jgi:hypothetical protein
MPLKIGLWVSNEVPVGRRKPEGLRDQHNICPLELDLVA